MDRQAFQRAWGEMVGKAWTDAAFKERLLAAPAAVFLEYGFEAPPNILLRVVSNGDGIIRVRCTRRGSPEWYVQCTSSCYRQPGTKSQVQIWSMWQAGWTEGATISLGARR